VPKPARDARPPAPARFQQPPKRGVGQAGAACPPAVALTRRGTADSRGSGGGGGADASAREVLDALRAAPDSDPRLQRIVLLGTPEDQAKLLHHYLLKFGLLTDTHTFRVKLFDGACTP